jgi:hypothetical protein
VEGTYTTMQPAEARRCWAAYAADTPDMTAVLAAIPADGCLLQHTMQHHTGKHYRCPDKYSPANSPNTHKLRGRLHLRAPCCGNSGVPCGTLQHMGSCNHTWKTAYRSCINAPRLGTRLCLPQPIVAPPNWQGGCQLPGLGHLAWQPPSPR